MRKIMLLIASIIVCFLIWATIGASAENIKVDIMINDFIKDATLIDEYSTKKNKYYKVTADFTLDSLTYSISNNKILPGGPGDIICTKEPANLPIVQPFIKYYVGGHAALSCFDYSDNSISTTSKNSLEITGFGSNIKASVNDKNYWTQNTYNEYMTFRVKTSLENRFRAFNKCLSFLGQSYNYSFIFNLSKTKYCSDLVQASYKHIGIDLDYDGVATTVLDLMVSPEVYLCNYSYLDETGTRHTYILM